MLAGYFILAIMGALRRKPKPYWFFWACAAAIEAVVSGIASHYDFIGTIDAPELEHGWLRVIAFMGRIGALFLVTRAWRRFPGANEDRSYFRIIIESKLVGLGPPKRTLSAFESFFRKLYLSTVVLLGISAAGGSYVATMRWVQYEYLDEVVLLFFVSPLVVFLSLSYWIRWLVRPPAPEPTPPQPAQELSGELES